MIEEMLSQRMSSLSLVAVILPVIAALVVTAGILGAAALMSDASPNSNEQGDLRTDAVKILVQNDGLYRLSRSEVNAVAPGLKAFDSNQLQLRQGGTDIPYWIEQDGLMFYGRSSDSRYASGRPYILSLGGTGKLMTEVASGSLDTPPPDTIPANLHLEQDNIYDGQARGADEQDNANFDPWYWATVQVQEQLAINIELDNYASGPSTVRLRLWGATESADIENDHDFDLLVNSRRVATIRWDGVTHFTGEATLPDGTLRKGSNTIVIDNQVEGATPIDIMRLDWLELSYEAFPVAVNDLLLLPGHEGTAELSGFSGKPRLFDIADPESPRIMQGWEYSDGQVRVGLEAGMHLLAVGPSGLMEPEEVEAVRKSNWRDPSRQADLIIVTTDELAPALAPLVEAREAQGLSVALAPVAEVYDEFGGGQSSPESITAFLRYAADRWKKPEPQYLLIVGEASYDFRNNLEQKQRNLVPALMVPVVYSGETVSDARLADLDQDLRPDLAVGRWPVDDVGEVEALVERTLAYERSEAPERAIFAADATSAEFSELSEQVLVNSGINPSSADSLYGESADDLAAAWNRGAWLVSYAGHGSLDRWGKDDVFSAESVSKLHSGTNPPIVLQLTCLTGFYAHPTVSSLSEQMLLHEGGPVLIIGATSLTLSSSQLPFGVEFLRELQNPATGRIGDALQRAKLQLDIENNDELREISDTFGLLGDPSALIVRP